MRKAKSTTNPLALASPPPMGEGILEVPYIPDYQLSFCPWAHV